MCFPWNKGQQGDNQRLQFGPGFTLALGLVLRVAELAPPL